LFYFCDVSDETKMFIIQPINLYLNALNSEVTFSQKTHNKKVIVYISVVYEQKVASKTAPLTMCK
jgi:hypothetical protein